jgi:hypothetical protein
MYKWTYCESKLKKLIDEGVPPLEEQLKIKISYIVTNRRLLRSEKLLANLINGRFNLCTVNEWKFLTSAKDCNIDDIHDTLQQW